jgi:hypothetical protein
MVIALYNLIKFIGYARLEHAIYLTSKASDSPVSHLSLLKFVLTKKNCSM